MGIDAWLAVQLRLGAEKWPFPRSHMYNIHMTENHVSKLNDTKDWSVVPLLVAAMLPGGWYTMEKYRVQWMDAYHRCRQAYVPVQ